MSKKHKNTYKVWINCWNCRTEVKFRIPKGISAKVYFERKPACPHCGVAGLDKELGTQYYYDTM